MTPAVAVAAEGPGPGIHWASPWFAPVAAAGRAVQALQAAACPLSEALNRAAPGPLCAVPQSALPEGMAYEAFIADTGKVPTRDNLHDLFNGLVWHRFPLAKRRLNRLQAAAIAAQGVGAARGPLRDAITVFDENAALLQAPPALWAALAARDWQRLFVGERALWSQARLVLFGHALLEKLVRPYKSITAHVFAEPVPMALGEDLSAWDSWLTGRLDAQGLASKPFTPLPVLGVPGWWPANQDPGFYADTGVFRPARAA